MTTRPNPFVLNYTAAMRHSLLGMYCSTGPALGLETVRATVRESSEVLAELAGREKAVALLDDLSSAVLSQTKLVDMAVLVVPTPSADKPNTILHRVVKPRWEFPPGWWQGVTVGVWATLIVQAIAGMVGK